jgi:outer membrane protein TolC
VLRDARDAVFAAWNQARGGAARTTAARAQEESAEAAARTAHERLTHGAGTELEALLADRDAFAARVARVQADADLGYARVLLRLAAARPLDAAVAP